MRTHSQICGDPSFVLGNITAFVTAIIDIKYTIIVYILLTIKDLTMLTKDKDFQKKKSTEL